MKKPPKLASWLLHKLSVEEESYSVQGDFEEGFNEIADTEGKPKAVIWYWLQVINSLPPFISQMITRGMAMFRSYLKIAVRNIVKRKMYTTINVFGLSIGIACSLLVYVYVTNELSYDSFHEKAERLFRPIDIYYNPDGSIKSKFRGVPLPAAPALAEYYPEIKHVVRLYNRNGIVRYEEKMFREEVLGVDTSFFTVFSFPLLKGDAESVLESINTAVVTQNIAHKYFGEDDPIGKTLLFKQDNKELELLITGLAENPPANSTIQFDIITNIKVYEAAGYQSFKEWFVTGHQMYVEFEEGFDINRVEERIPSFLNQYASKEIDRKRKFWEGKGAGLMPMLYEFQNIEDIHLDASVDKASEVQKLYLLSAIALIVLIIASINYMTISTGISSLRSVEIGIRKVIGAQRKQLIKQFWSESLLLTFFAGAVSILWLFLAYPVFNELSGKDISPVMLADPKHVTFMVLLISLVGLLSGSYPALIMSRFRPLEVMKGVLKLNRKNVLTRIMTVAQFSLSVFLIILTVIIGRQISYLNNKELGYNKEGIVQVNLYYSADRLQLLERLRDKLRQFPNIINISGYSGDLAGYSIDNSFRKGSDYIQVNEIKVDHNYFEALGIPFVKGRNFSREIVSDTLGIVVNEAFTKTYGFQEPIGTAFKRGTLDYRIIGVVKDYHIGSLKDEILPAIHFTNRRWGLSNILIRTANQNISETMELLKQSWKELQPDVPFFYSFLDESLKQRYQSEQKWGKIVNYSSIFSILIACLGVFGLTSITVGSKIKEIGIRKVLGARILQIIGIIVKEFIWLVVLANIIAWPVAYTIMRRFLDNYHYRVGIELQYFIAAGVLSLALALFAIMYLSVKASLANPTDALRYE